MEVLNSGTTQTDPLRLFHDWMGLLNRGLSVTPVGSSDSHDVGRHFVGQGRTYIRCNDRDPSHLDIDEAVNNFIQGRVLVSYGLLAELTVNEKYRSGETAACVSVPQTEHVDFSDFAAGWLSFSLFVGGTLSVLAGGRLGTSLESYFDPADTWITVMRTLVGKNFS